MNKETMRQAILAYLDRKPRGELAQVNDTACCIAGEKVGYGNETYMQVWREMNLMKEEGLIGYYSHRGWYAIGSQNDLKIPKGTKWPEALRLLTEAGFK
jgi:hypothetical protein